MGLRDGKFVWKMGFYLLVTGLTASGLFTLAIAQEAGHRERGSVDVDREGREIRSFHSMGHTRRMILGPGWNGNSMEFER
jgi:hypothetical protein